MITGRRRKEDRERDRQTGGRRHLGDEIMARRSRERDGRAGMEEGKREMVRHDSSDGMENTKKNRVPAE